MCSEHKTSSTYGDLAKWLAPGTCEALRLYMRLPRRADVQTLLHPATENAETVNVPCALRQFCAAHFLPTQTHPTTTLLRKWYHTELIKLCKVENKLLEVFRVADAHSGRVARQHYVLRDPADDATLARELVMAMLTETVKWPELLECADADPAILQAMQAVTEMHAESTDAADDDEPLEWVDCTHFKLEWLGVCNQVSALTDAPGVSSSGGAAASSGQPLPALEDKASTPSSGGGAGVAYDFG